MGHRLLLSCRLQRRSPQPFMGHRSNPTSPFHLINLDRNQIDNLRHTPVEPDECQRQFCLSCYAWSPGAVTLTPHNTTNSDRFYPKGCLGAARLHLSLSTSTWPRMHVLMEVESFPVLSWALSPVKHHVKASAWEDVWAQNIRAPTQHLKHNKTKKKVHLNWKSHGAKVISDQVLKRCPSGLSVPNICHLVAHLYLKFWGSGVFDLISACVDQQHTEQKFQMSYRESKKCLLNISCVINK